MCFKTATSLKSHPIHPRTFISLIPLICSNPSPSLNSPHSLKLFSQPQPFSRPQFPTSSNPTYSSHEFPPHNLKSHLHAYSPRGHSHPSHKLSPLSYASPPHETPQATQYIHKPPHIPNSSHSLNSPHNLNPSPGLNFPQAQIPPTLPHGFLPHELKSSPSRLLPSRPFSSLSQAFTPHTLQTPMKPHKPPWYFKASMRSKSHPRS
ncbi:hypothetical protein BscR1v2_013950 [Bartonella schoenbuchensis R1]|uniref:Uncharacterized protein n=1 Tax=Bartonella schoenbuchensis (strain DSM 13525 / NCTC 13165 / R1) TaxID=687861 RepID=A0A1S6XSG1_BARSR|nr:hypothetical protein BscR1v2_013950 [Bartonella schoenbuchensis R1]